MARRTQPTPTMTPRMYNSSLPDSAENAARSARRMRRGVLWLAGLMAAATLSATLLWSPAASVRRIVVRGVSSLPRAEQESILRAVNAQTRLSYLAFPWKDVRARLLAQPVVREASATKWPPFHLTLAIAPRRPEGLLEVMGQVWQVDSEGVPIRAGALPSDRPLVVSERLPRISPGRRIQDSATLAALTLARTHKPSAGPAPAKIVVDHRGDLCLNMADGMVVRAGPATQLREKLAVVERMYRADPQTAAKLEEIDVRVVSVPLCKPIGSKQNASSQASAAGRSDERSRSSSSAQSGGTARAGDSARSAVR